MLWNESDSFNRRELSCSLAKSISYRSIVSTNLKMIYRISIYISIVGMNETILVRISIMYYIVALANHILTLNVEVYQDTTMFIVIVVISFLRSLSLPFIRLLEVSVFFPSHHFISRLSGLENFQVRIFR